MLIMTYRYTEYLSIMQSYYLVHVPTRNSYTMPSFGKNINNDTLNTSESNVTMIDLCAYG
jgi:hypothetical protein